MKTLWDEKTRREGEIPNCKEQSGVELKQKQQKDDKDKKAVKMMLQTSPSTTKWLRDISLFYANERIVCPSKLSRTS